MNMRAMLRADSCAGTVWKIWQIFQNLQFYWMRKNCMF